MIVKTDAEIAAAKRLDSRIRLMASTVADNFAKLSDLVAEAKRGEIHIALGFKSWTGYLADALGGRLQLDSESRRNVVELLTGEGMSNRAIAQAVGVNEITVRRDKEQVRHDVAPEPAPLAPASWSPTPWTPTPEPPAPLSTRESDPPWVTAAIEDHNAKVAKQPAEVTGLDGKTYGKPRPKPKREPAASPATFAALMKRLTDLNRVGAECLDIAEAISFKTDANWCGMTYDPEQQHESASALATGLTSLVDGIVTAIAKAESQTC